jgi:type VI secretion system secreted protein Hcp
MATGLNNICSRLCVLLCLALLPNVGLSAISSYLFLPGLPGESSDASHQNWIVAQSFQFGMEKSASANDPDFADLSIIKPVDTASPLLAQQCAVGSYIPSANLQVVNAADSLVYQIKLDNVYVTSVNTASETGGAALAESTTLRFGKITWTYTQYDNTGANPTNTSTSWDQLFGKTPIILTVNGAQNVGSGTMNITWTVRSGATYKILGSPQVNGNYTLIRTITTTNLGPMTVTMPTAGNTFFFRIQEVP